MDWVGSGGKQENAKLERSSVIEPYFLSLRIKGRDPGIEDEIYLPFTIIVWRAQGNPIFLGRAREVIL